MTRHRPNQSNLAPVRLLPYKDSTRSISLCRQLGAVHPLALYYGRFRDFGMLKDPETYYQHFVQVADIVPRRPPLLLTQVAPHLKLKHSLETWRQPTPHRARVV